MINIPETPVEHITAADLALEDDMPVNFVVEDLVTESGLTILAGPTNVGKSYLALNMAYSIILGAPTLGNKATQQSRVSYVASDDDRTTMGVRNQEFIDTYKMHEPARAAVLNNLQYSLNLFYPDQIEELVTKNPFKPDVVFIDTLSLLLSAAGIRATQEDMIFKYLRSLTSLGEETKTTFVLLHHTTKELDEFNEDVRPANVHKYILGSQAVQAGTVNRLVLYKHKNFYHLTVRSKRSPFADYLMDVDVERGTWNITNDHATRNMPIIMEKVMLMMNKHPRDGFSPKEALDAMIDEGFFEAKDAPTRQGVDKTMRKLRKNGTLRKEGSQYFYTTTPDFNVTRKLTKIYPSPVDISDEAMPGDDVRQVAFA